MDSAFPKEVARLRDLVHRSALDIEAFCQRLLPCDLKTCRGTCCHDGVYLSYEEAEKIRSLVVENRDYFDQIDVDTPIVYGKFRDVASGPKTATREAPMSQRVKDYPAHFSNTECCFLLKDATCSLQRFSVATGRHPWYYKPFTCWIHPLAFSDCDSQPLLTLHNSQTDPHTYDDYPGFGSKTHCGRVCEHTADTLPAYQALKPELAFLSEISGRDLYTEILSSVAEPDI